MLLAFEDEAALAQRLAQALGRPLALVQQHRSPDGETRLRLPSVMRSSSAMRWPGRAPERPWVERD